MEGLQGCEGIGALFDSWEVGLMYYDLSRH